MGKVLAEVQPLVDLTLSRLAKRKFREDPLLGPDISRKTSLASSAQRRHGFIIEHALLCALKQDRRFVVWNDPKFPVSAVADNMVSAEPDKTNLIGANIGQGPATRTVQVDAIVYDKRKKMLSAYEVKRGNDKHDSGKIRSMLRDLACVQVLLASYGKARKFPVSKARSLIIFYYGQCSIGKPFSLTRDELDDHFGTSVIGEVEAVNRYFRSQLLAML